MKNIIVIITGLPGTGKTTFARALAQEIQAAHLNTDMTRDRLGKRGQYDPGSKSEIYRNMLQQAEQFLDQGKNIVIDGTFYKESYRETFQKMAESGGRDIRWIELHADESVIGDRLSEKRQYSEADFEVYKKIKSLYEPLKRSHLVLWSDQLSVREMIQRAKDFLMLPA